jgi:hypothetical protein
MLNKGIKNVAKKIRTSKSHCMVSLAMPNTAGEKYNKTENRRVGINKGCSKADSASANLFNTGVGYEWLNAWMAESSNTDLVLSIRQVNHKPLIF